jgi:hypothetical protein
VHAVSSVLYKQAMMKQFHNRSTKEGTWVWDVDRLIRLAHNLPVKTIPLASIFEFDEVYWFDDQHRPTCRAVVSHLQRIQAADLSIPIILSADGHVMDGMHRVAKAWLLGHTEIRAVQFTQDPEPDQILATVPDTSRGFGPVTDD